MNTARKPISDADIQNSQALSGVRYANTDADPTAYNPDTGAPWSEGAWDGNVRPPTQDSSPFGSLGPIVAIAAALAGSAIGIPPVLTNMVTSAMNGGDPMSALLSPSGLMSAAGFGMNAGGVDMASLTADANNAFQGAGELALPGETSTATGLLDSAPATAPMQLADAGNTGNTMTDVSGGYGDAPKLDASDASASTGSSQPGGLLNSSINDVAGPGKTYDAFGNPIANADAATTQASQMASSTAANQGADMTANGAPATSGPASSGPTGTGGGGLLDSTVDWAKKNPQIAGPLAAAGITTAGSMLKGVGDRANAKEMLERKIAGEKELLDKKTQNTMELAEWQRRFGQAGSLSAPITGASSNPSQVLRRPDGSPVYGQNGLLFSN